MTNELAQLTKAAKELAQAVTEYQRAITAARAAGATWGEMATAMELSRASVRGRVRVATQGGEMHIKVPKLKKEE